MTPLCNLEREVAVLYRHYRHEEVTWEMRDAMQKQYSQLLKESGHTNAVAIFKRQGL
jgi:hypothetical protein